KADGDDGSIQLVAKTDGAEAERSDQSDFRSDDDCGNTDLRRHADHKRESRRGYVGNADGRELLRRQNRSIPRFAAAELHDAAIRRDAAAASKFQPLEEQRDERRIAKRAVSG